MGKFVGLVGALTTLGAMAYLMTPLPPADQTSERAKSAAVPIAASRSAPVVPAASPTSPSVTVASAPARQAAPTLVHQIQIELRRVGCYSGNIDGQWSEATQRAMQALGERVSVLRPVDTPDYIMLALARDQQGNACSQSQQRATASRPLTSFRTTASSTGSDAAQSPNAPNAPAARRTGATPSRTSASDPARAPRASELDQAEAARAAAARDELARLETRAPIVTRSTVAPDTVSATADQAPVEPSPPTLERSRMSLGVADVDPLRAGIDPRDPNAPAILRGPPAPARVSTARVETQVERSDAVAPPVLRRSPLAASELPTPPTVKQKRRVWQRAIFNDMQRNGP